MHSLLIWKFAFMRLCLYLLFYLNANFGFLSITRETCIQRRVLCSSVDYPQETLHS